ncbi:MAG: hypothetical protein COT61_00090 [Candidatus Portnoybacteria bacterium CG09_land_8_20_14_0_10_44_13]|uniref:Dockerin domain-containing protein n=2 Tax=Candidatus Portnoyibacteriota TaxID=1817913 RepID=A0A2H0WYY6_9BACT|nr:MAG: hypothetical protein COT61_00090 [Candidatus Portnoybacteria bacterium CG09_land_8_20_14_0_10_44_13]
MKRNYLLFFCFLGAIILIAGFKFFPQKTSADTTSAVTFTVKISVCGNSEKEYGEDCDNNNFGGMTCQSLGYSSGTLTCTVACEYNTSQCVSGPSCGDGSCNGSETCSSCPADCGSCGGGGGGGGGYIAPVTSVVFSGRAYPKSAVTLLKDAQVAATTIAGADANFRINVSGLSGGNYIFAVYSEDSKGIRSSLLTFPVSVTSGATTNVSGIFVAPTIAVDKSEVKRGDNIAIFGQSAPQADMVISVSSEEEFFAKTISDKDGIYFYNFDSSFVDYGTHYTKSKASISNLETSGFSSVISFKVGTKNVIAIPEKAALKGDLNNDGRVNLVDFSIAAYWYKRPSPPASVDLNNDGKVDLVDFSIMAYYWTG